MEISNATLLPGRLSPVTEKSPMFGIGTPLTNDFGRSPLNLVMKMVDCNGQPVAKISDSPGKGVYDNENFMR